MSCSTDTKQEEAVAHATMCSDKFGMPQTVYKNADSGGWWHTNAFARLLERAQVFVTMLPENYYR